MSLGISHTRPARRVTATLILAAVTCLSTAYVGPAYAGPAYVAPAHATSADASGGLDMSVDAANPLSPTVTLTNHTGAPCQVATISTGAVGVTSLTQGGKSATPIATAPTFPDGLDVYLENSLATLAPGASATIALRVVPLGPTGHALETVTWSQLASLGALYPLSGGAARITATYALPPLHVDGAPLCPPAAAGSVDAAAAPPGGMPVWLVVGGVALLALLLALLIALLWRRSRRSRHSQGPQDPRGSQGPPGGARAAAAALLLLAGVTVAVGLGPARAYATIDVDPSLQSTYASCGPLFGMPGGDPADLFPTLNDPNNHVRIISNPRGDTHEIRVGDTIIILWNPNDHHRYAGKGHAYADPCSALYHEMYHSKKSLTGTLDRSRCVTADGDSGLPTSEVNASKAENILRVLEGLEPRETYGNTPLPSKPCLPPDQQPKPETPCAGDGCGSSNGDPHLLTFDGLRYDFQAVGEFVAVRQAGDPGFQIQTRQQPAGASATVAVTTAVAMAVAGDRVEVDLTPDGMALVVNGAAAPLAGVTLPHGGSVTLDVSVTPAQLVTAWPDGSRAYLRRIGAWGLHLIAAPAHARAGKLSGLLGDFDGEPGNDVRAASGKALATPPAFDALYPGFADGWRVTGATSLFTYPKGASTGIYTDRSRPAAPPDVRALPAAAAAEQLCRGIGVVDRQTLADCVLDVAETGQASFAGAALDAQGLLAPAAPPPAPGPTSSSTIGAASREATLSVDKANGAAKLTFPGTAGQRLFLEILSSTTPGQCGVLNLADAAGNTLDIGCVDSTGHGVFGGDLLPTTGAYTLTFKPADGATGQIRVRLTFSTDVRAAMPVDGSAVTAVIGTPGQVGLYTFHGAIGDRVLIEATGVTLPNQCGVPVLKAPDGTAIAQGCVGPEPAATDGVPLTTSGQFTVVVDPAGADTGQVVLRLIVSHDRRGAIEPNSDPVTAVVDTPGQVAQYAFTGAKGQKMSVKVTASTVKPQCGALAVRDPAGVRIAIGCVGADGTGGIDSFTLPAGGTYTLEVDPDGLDTGTMTLALHAP